MIPAYLAVWEVVGHERDRNPVVPQQPHICHVNVLGRHIVILNTYKAMLELLSRRSANYSRRPHTIMLQDECVYFTL